MVGVVVVSNEDELRQKVRELKREANHNHFVESDVWLDEQERIDRERNNTYGKFLANKLKFAVQPSTDSLLLKTKKQDAIEELEIILKSIKTELKNRQEFFLTRMDKCNKLRLEINTLEGIEKKQAVRRRINLWENIKEDIGYDKGVKMIILKIEKRLKELKEVEK